MHGTKMSAQVQVVDAMHVDEDNDRKQAGAEDTTKDHLNSDPQTATLPFRQLLSCADAFDWIMMFFGTLGSIIHGLAQPIGYLLLGKALDAYGNNIGDNDAMVKALKKVNPSSYLHTLVKKKVLFSPKTSL